MLARRIGHRFDDPSLLVTAVSHRAWCAEQGGPPSHERLEFLGDAVLGLVVAEYSFHAYPEMPEGMLAKLRASVVNTQVLADVARELDVGPALRLGRGEDASGGRGKASILADAVEGVIGAVYLDGGLAAARSLVVSLLADRMGAVVDDPGVSDHKSRLQEAAVARGDGVPRYEVHGHGPDHARRYAATVYVADQRLGLGEGRSKKDAEQAAARAALAAIGDETGQRGVGDA